MAASVVATDAWTSTGVVSSTDVPLPAHLADDVLVIMVDLNQASGVIDTPAGWTAFRGESTGADLTSRAFWRRASSSSAAGSVSVSHSGSRRTSACSVVVRDGEDPYFNMATSSANGPSDPVYAPETTITDDDTLLIDLIAYRTSATWTPVNSWVEIDFADGGSTNTGVRVMEAPALVDAGLFPETDISYPSVFNRTDSWLIAFGPADTGGGSVYNDDLTATAVSDVVFQHSLSGSEQLTVSGSTTAELTSSVVSGHDLIVAAMTGVAVEDVAALSDDLQAVGVSDVELTSSLEALADLTSLATSTTSVRDSLRASLELSVESVTTTVAEDQLALWESLDATGETLVSLSHELVVLADLVTLVESAVELSDTLVTEAPNEDLTVVAESVVELESFLRSVEDLVSSPQSSTSLSDALSVSVDLEATGASSSSLSSWHASHHDLQTDATSATEMATLAVLSDMLDVDVVSVASLMEFIVAKVKGQFGSTAGVARSVGSIPRRVHPVEGVGR